MFFVFNRYCKQIDDKNRDPPATKNIDKSERKSKQHKRLVENIKKRVVQHDETENEENHP
jgi:hypothetical protein